MKRGEIWTVSGGSGYTGKPRPAVVVQDDHFSGTGSVTLCPFTTDASNAPLLRLVVNPTATNGLRASCRLMLDKLTTVPKTRLGYRVGALDQSDVQRLNRGMVVFLGLAGG